MKNKTCKKCGTITNIGKNKDQIFFICEDCIISTPMLWQTNSFNSPTLWKPNIKKENETIGCG